MEAMEIVADYGDKCGEGPLWDWRSGVLYWTDITGKRFYRYLWEASEGKERKHELMSEGFEVAGAALLKGGGFLVVNSGGIWFWDGWNTPENIIDEVEGRRCVLNDCAVDPRGRLFAGSAFYDAANPDYELGCLFRMDPDGSARVVDEGIRLSNGIGFSPDETQLYFVDSASRLIYVYDYAAESGEIRNRRVLVKVPPEQGVPDGLTVDAEGFVWCAHWFGGGVFRYDPDGRLEREIRVPAAQTSSLTFGGPELMDIFVTTAGTPDALALAPEGYRAEDVYSGGRLFHINAGIQGRREYLAEKARVKDSPRKDL